MLNSIDYFIIFLYFVMVAFVGLYSTKKAASSVDGYFLGDRKLPWYILGISGVATFIDMAGTMLQVSFFYMLGVKGYWVAYRGAICIFLAFFMIFMAKWLNRSCVMTNAEWVEFRFGSGKQGRTARFLNAISMLIIVVPLISYLFIGTGKFLAIYMPFSPTTCALIFFGVVMIYTVAAGLYGVVYTDLLQSFFILLIIIFVSIKALMIGTPEYYSKFANSDWLKILPTWKADMPPGYENMHLLGMLIIFWIVMNIMQGFAMPLDPWTGQRYYAAKNERESSLVAWQWIVLFSLRFPLMMGMGVLALSVMTKGTDPELALPAVINTFVPIGLKGIMLSAVIAAAMSTLSGFVNSTAAYFVNDIYHAYLKPSASRKDLVKMSYITSAAIVVVGVIVGWKIPNINTIWAWIIMGLLTGTIPPNILKWFWWRFNGIGYAFGMGFGILGAILDGLFFPNAPEYITFMIAITVSTAGTLIGTFLGKPADDKVLAEFYKKTRPFGFWEPVRKMFEPGFIADVKKENLRDILLIAPASIWQVTLYWMMCAFVVKKWTSFGFSFLIVAFLSMILYKYWYLNLKKG